MCDDQNNNAGNEIYLSVVRNLSVNLDHACATTKPNHCADCRKNGDGAQTGQQLTENLAVYRTRSADLLTGEARREAEIDNDIDTAGANHVAQQISAKDFSVET